VRGAQVTDAGMKELAALQKLTFLNLSNTKVTDAGLKELAGLKSLYILSLEGTRVTAEGVEKFQKALPNCQISK
jgi:internalin A